jgi:hypothetical protein
MKKAVILAFDDHVQGNGVVYLTDTSLNLALALYDKLGVQIVTDNATGTSPTITVELQHSNDGRNWHVKSTLVSAQAVSTTASTTFFGSDNGSTPSMALCRLNITLGGTNPSCKVRIHVCARDDS